MRRECVFPSIDWVLEVHTAAKGSPNTQQLPPKATEFTPSPCPPIYIHKRYEPYLWDYAQRVHVKKAQRVHNQVMISLATTHSTSKRSSRYVDTASIVTSRTSDTEYTTNISSLNIELSPQPQETPAPGLWIKVRLYLNSVLRKIRHLIIPRPAHQNDSEC